MPKPELAANSPTVVANPARRAAAGIFIGGVLEYYDFYIYGLAAALVFGKLFFPGGGVLSTLFAIATFAVAYVVRPLGGLIFGHLGDRLGRRRITIVTIALMGSCTFIIGCLPTYAQAGIIGPILLVLMRILQGISAGGELPGSSSLMVELAPFGKRALYSSWNGSGSSIGFIISSLVFIPISSLPASQLQSWGWRVPFLASFVITVIGYVLRRTLRETGVFLEAKRERQLVNKPLVDLLHTRGSSLIRAIACYLATVVNTMVPIFGLSYAIHTVGIKSSTMLWVTVVSQFCAFLFIPVLATVSDKVGRKPVFIGACLGSGVSIFGYFYAISTGNVALILVATVVCLSVFFSGHTAVNPAFLAEMFPVRMRYTGLAAGTQLGLVIPGIAPTLATAMVGGNVSNWLPAAVLVAALTVVSAIAAATATETYKVPLERLGGELA